MHIKQAIEKNRDGHGIGLPSFCTANDHVIEALFEYATKHNVPVLLEATCNQVNQFGGYTGMRPIEFVKKVQSKANDHGLAEGQLILGGDHLGPNPWRHLPADEAMEHAKELVRQYVIAGFTKIHLDASMSCGEEDTPSFSLVAERAAILCEVAEKSAPDANKLVYIVGTEVPIPGGETEAMDTLQITTREHLHETIQTHQDAFYKRSLQAAWSRVVSVVVQPGVDFSHTNINHYCSEKALDLSTYILTQDQLTFEAHSTDYQTTKGLNELVNDHCFFLKVGPELTFAFREAVISLCHIDQRLTPNNAVNLEQQVLTLMDSIPDDWIAYYKGSNETQNYLKIFSYSDRIRYYWDTQQIKQALSDMLGRLSQKELPREVVSQYFDRKPYDLEDINPSALLNQSIQKTINRYYIACGYNT